MTTRSHLAASSTVSIAYLDAVVYVQTSDKEDFFMQRQPLSVCVIVTPLPPGRPGSSRYQGASCVTLFSRKGWPLGRGLRAGVVSPLWLVFFRPAAACVRAPLMGLLSGRAPGLCWSAPPENSPPAKGILIGRKIYIMRSLGA